MAVWEGLGRKVLLALETEERGTMSQGKQTVPRRWKSEEMDSSLDIPKGMQPHQHLGFSPVRLISDFGPPGL